MKIHRKEYTQLKERYDMLKSQLSNQKCYPYTNQMLNLPAFVKQNQNLYMRLTLQRKALQALRNQSQKNTATKQNPYYMNNSLSSNATSRDEEKISDLKNKNEILRQSIQQYKDQQAKKNVVQFQNLKQKQNQLKAKKNQVQKLTQMYSQLKRAEQNREMLQLYEIKCRQCESLRKINNDLSEQLKKVIAEVNRQTGSQQNPNMFLMNLKV